MSFLHYLFTWCAPHSNNNNWQPEKDKKKKILKTEKKIQIPNISPTDNNLPCTYYQQKQPNSQPTLTKAIYESNVGNANSFYSRFCFR